MADCCAPQGETNQQRKLLWIVLSLNAAMFFVEFIAGWIAQSTGLLADSLDMLADAFVYGLSLYAVGKANSYKSKAALLNGTLQLSLGILVIIDVIKRAIWGAAPDVSIMYSVAFLALLVNITCFGLLYRFRKGDINLRASWICSRNDMLANAGVIISAAMVNWFGKAWPDWLIGAIIAATIIISALGIIRSARHSLRTGESSESSSCCS